jgi:hypothetical protein
MLTYDATVVKGGQPKLTGLAWALRRWVAKQATSPICCRWHRLNQVRGTSYSQLHAQTDHVSALS